MLVHHVVVPSRGHGDVALARIQMKRPVELAHASEGHPLRLGEVLVGLKTALRMAVMVP